jgi:hypothetical protein
MPNQQNRSKVDILFDSVYTINQVLSQTPISTPGTKNSIVTILTSNKDYINICLANPDFTSVLTPQQTMDLNAAVTLAQNAIDSIS